MVLDGGVMSTIRVFLVAYSHCSPCLANIFHITFITFHTIYHPTLLKFVRFVLRSYKLRSECVVGLMVGVDTMLLENSLELLTKALDVRKGYRIFSAF